MTAPSHLSPVASALSRAVWYVRSTAFRRKKPAETGATNVAASLSNSVDRALATASERIVSDRNSLNGRSLHHFIRIARVLMPCRRCESL
jgi:hypothetical protein